MKTMIRCMIMLTLLAFSAAGQANGGRIISVEGLATVKRGDTAYRAVRHGVIQQSDVVYTGTASRLQWWMADDSMYTLGAKSRLVITEYQLNSKRKNASKRLGKLAFNLLKGGFRSISGFIGSRDKSAYTVKSPSATMGIRGTDYTIYFVDEQLGNELGLAPGTYVKVNSGAVDLSNTTASIPVETNQIGFAPLAPSQAPRLVANAPDILLQLFNREDFEFGADFFLDLDIDIRIEPEIPASAS